MTQDNLQSTIDAAWENRANLSPQSAPKEVLDAVEHTIAELNNGKLRVATRESVGQWTTHQWIKKAVLLSFRLKDNELMRAGDLGFFDKVPTKFADLSESEMRATGVRVVPPAVARRGSFIAKGAILMPSYVNIGAWVGEGTMVDTWATVGSCAQVGNNVHLSGGVGLGGVLEPLALQAAARETLRLCRPSKPAQAGLEPRAPAPRGPLRLRPGKAGSAAPAGE
jgi:2,3,4,5-tetrahydropyridine-2-carboxylate N-succinyltransferase